MDLVGALHPLTVITREPVLKYIMTFLLGRHLHGFPSGASAAYPPFPSTTSSLNYIISDGFPQAQLLNRTSSLPHLILQVSFPAKRSTSLRIGPRLDFPSGSPMLVPLGKRFPGIESHSPLSVPGLRDENNRLKICESSRGREGEETPRT